MISSSIKAVYQHFENNITNLTNSPSYSKSSTALYREVQPVLSQKITIVAFMKGNRRECFFISKITSDNKF